MAWGVFSDTQALAGFVDGNIRDTKDRCDLLDGHVLDKSLE
tara:strand:+ start:2289 stop:2411 length:123 start_codon:yes stop_codon:yes gene_type:complete